MQQRPLPLTSPCAPPLPPLPRRCAGGRCKCSRVETCNRPGACSKVGGAVAHDWHGRGHAGTLAHLARLAAAAGLSLHRQCAAAAMQQL